MAGETSDFLPLVPLPGELQNGSFLRLTNQHDRGGEEPQPRAVRCDRTKVLPGLILVIISFLDQADTGLFRNQHYEHNSVTYKAINYTE